MLQVAVVVGAALLLVGAEAVPDNTRNSFAGSNTTSCTGHTVADCNN